MLTRGRTIAYCGIPLLLAGPVVFFGSLQLSAFLNRIPNTSTSHFEYSWRLMTCIAALTLIVFAVAGVLATARAAGAAKLGRAVLIVLALAALTWIVPTFLAIGHIATEALCYSVAAILWVAGVGACARHMRAAAPTTDECGLPPVPALPPTLPALTALVIVGSAAAVMLGLLLGKLTALGLAHGID